MSWPTVEIGTVAEIVSGSTPSTATPDYWGGDVPWATPADLAKLAGKLISSTPRMLTARGLEASSARLLPVGSVLFSSRAPIGHVAINAVPMATNQGFKSFVPDPSQLSADFLYWWLKSNTTFLQGLGVGATFKEVSKAIVKRVKIPLPPLPEQRRIASILDRADELRAKRRSAIELLNFAERSAFLESFGSPIDSIWPSRRIGELLESATYGTSEKAGPTGEFPILRMGNITPFGAVDTTNLKYIDLPNSDPSRYLVRRGDILFNRTNSVDLVGKTAVYRSDSPMAYAGYLVRMRVNEHAHPDYIAGFLNSPFGKAKLRGMAKSIVGMANINAKEVQAIAIPVPPMERQLQFALVNEQIEALKGSHFVALTQLDKLFAVLQHRAFSE